MTFPTSIKEHRDNVGRLVCVVSGRPNPTLHHAQGPSIRAKLVYMGFDPTKSQSMRGNGEALLIPLAMEYHTGVNGIDTGFGRASWEDTYGLQSDFIDQVSAQVGYDLWTLYRMWAKPTKIVRRRV